MADYGLIGGFAEGIKAGLQGYQQIEQRNYLRKLQDENMRLKLTEAGLTRNDDGTITDGPPAKAIYDQQAAPKPVPGDQPMAQGQQQQPIGQMDHPMSQDSTPSPETMGLLRGQATQPQNMTQMNDPNSPYYKMTGKWNGAGGAQSGLPPSGDFVKMSAQNAQAPMSEYERRKAQHPIGSTLDLHEPAIAPDPLPGQEEQYLKLPNKPKGLIGSELNQDSSTAQYTKWNPQTNKFEPIDMAGIKKIEQYSGQEQAYNGFKQIPASHYDVNRANELSQQIMGKDAPVIPYGAPAKSVQQQILNMQSNIATNNMWGNRFAGMSGIEAQKEQGRDALKNKPITAGDAKSAIASLQSMGMKGSQLETVRAALIPGETTQAQLKQMLGMLGNNQNISEKAGVNSEAADAKAEQQAMNSIRQNRFINKMKPLLNSGHRIVETVDQIMDGSIGSTEQALQILNEERSNLARGGSSSAHSAQASAYNSTLSKIESSLRTWRGTYGDLKEVPPALLLNLKKEAMGLTQNYQKAIVNEYKQQMPKSRVAREAYQRSLDEFTNDERDRIGFVGDDGFKDTVSSVNAKQQAAEKARGTGGGLLNSIKGLLGGGQPSGVAPQPQARPTPGPTPGSPEEHSAALDWARTNQNDPRAAAIINKAKQNGVQ